MSPETISAPDGFLQSQHYDAITQSATFFNAASILAPTLDPSLLSSGRIKSDKAETERDYDDSQWQSWDGNPVNLEHNDIIKGHAWYRAELQLNGWFGLPWWEPSDLFVEHASDIVGIYVNGHYITTVSPMGTEIDSDSKNVNYRFPKLRRYLKRGKNVIAFRTEIWGHGSFMFPRGKLLGSKAQIPAVGFDSVKGLYGSASVGWRKLENWSVRADLNGELTALSAPTTDDSSWEMEKIPSELEKGDVRWYRTTFDVASLPDQETLHAPVVLTLKGKNTKATIFLNGRLIGRWISNDEWLERGFWGRAQRDMWMNTDPDDFPVNIGMLNPPGQSNTLAIVFEDTSGHNEEAGTIDLLQFNYARENEGASAFKGRTLISLD